MILFITAFVCIFMDGSIGLVLGAVISLMRTAIKSQAAQHIDVGYERIKMQGQISYINAAQVEEELQNAIAKMRANKIKKIYLDLTGVPFIDVDGVEAL